MAKVLAAHVRQRRATHTDVEIGRKVRALRLERGMSQTTLADLIGLTFQQVQKYEKGVNRVSVGRLMQIAKALNVPVSFFTGQESKGDEPPDFAFLSTAKQLRLSKAFAKIRSHTARDAIVALTECLSTAEA